MHYILQQLNILGTILLDSVGARGSNEKGENNIIFREVRSPFMFIVSCIIISLKSLLLFVI